MTALLLVALLRRCSMRARQRFFVAGEYALVRSRPLGKLWRRSKTRTLAVPACALKQVDEIGEYISAVQVGITMTSIGIGCLGEPVAGRPDRAALRRPLARRGDRDLGHRRLR